MLKTNIKTRRKSKASATNNFKIQTLESKILSISNKLLKLRTFLIIQKYKLKSKEDTIQKYLVEKEVDTYDKFVSDMELEFNMYKYILQNLES